jgi:nitrogen fixation/metabolism regulation signal transduction histidine kinase
MTAAPGDTRPESRRLTIGDGINLGIGIFIAWVVVIPAVLVLVTFALLLCGVSISAFFQQVQQAAAG